MFRPRFILIPLIPILIYAGWVVYPPLRDPSGAKAILERCAQREATWQASVHDSRENAYLDPLLHPFWGRKGIDHQENSQVHKILRETDSYCFMVTGKNPERLSEALKEDPKKVASDYEGLIELHRHVRKVIALPSFVYPIDGPRHFETKMPALLSLRSLVAHFASYAEYLSLLGQTDQALGVCQDIFRLSRLISSGQQSNLEAAIALAMQSIGWEAIATVLEDAQVQPSAPELRQLANAVQQAQLGTDDWLKVTEAEIYATCNTRRALSGEQGGFDFLSLPGMTDRELRIYQNEMMALMHNAHVAPAVGSPPEFSWARWFVGQQGYMAWLLVPIWSETRPKFVLSETRSATMQLYLGLYAQAREEGKWPTELPPGAAASGPLSASRVDYQVKGKTMKLTVLPDQGLPNTVAEPEPWNHVTDRGWVLRASL